WQAEEEEKLRPSRIDGIGEVEVAVDIELIGGDRTPLQDWQSNVGGAEHSVGFTRRSIGAANDEVSAGLNGGSKSRLRSRSHAEGAAAGQLALVPNQSGSG